MIKLKIYSFHILNLNKQKNIVLQTSTL